MFKYNIEKEWTYKRFKCIVIFNGYFRCGDVGIPKTHIAYGVHYDNVNIYVHGGLTYSGNLIHIVNNDLWWFGFDCAHASDKILSLPSDSDHFWILAEVIEETNRLADRLSTIKPIDLISPELMTKIIEKENKSIEQLSDKILLEYINKEMVVGGL